MHDAAQGQAKPSNADTLTREACFLWEAGKFQEAFNAANQAITIDPRHALAHLYRGLVLHATGNIQAAFNDLTRAKALAPENPTVHSNIAVVLYNGKNYLGAIAALQKTITLIPEYENSWNILADCYCKLGDHQTARNLFKKIMLMFPKNMTDKMELAYMFPPIIPSKEAIDTARAEFVHNLDRLMQEHFTYTALEKQVQYFPFYHLYHARSHKELMEKLCKFFHKTAPHLAYTAPHAKLPLAPKSKIRIGFVMDYPNKNVIGQFVQTLLDGIAASQDFETVLILTKVPPGADVTQLTANIDHTLTVPIDTAAAQQAIAKEKLDILTYTEIGTNIPSYLLALSRLAPIQINLGIHPVTSGISTIDYFISYNICEPENAQTHYTEKLIQFDSPLTIFKRPVLPKTISTREQLNLPLDERLYCCPVVLFKVHPDMDSIFAGILARDPKARIILFDSHEQTLWRTQLEKRFGTTIPAHDLTRITFLPFAPKEQLFEILYNCDAILDTVHYAFGTTAFLSFGAGLPFVTWPGEFARGRWPYMMYTRMGITDLIATTHDDYVELALRLANDKTFRSEIAEKIRARSDVLFDDHTAIDRLGEWLKTLYDSHCVNV